MRGWAFDSKYSPQHNFTCLRGLLTTLGVLVQRGHRRIVIASNQVMCLRIALNFVRHRIAQGVQAYREFESDGRADAWHSMCRHYGAGTMRSLVRRFSNPTCLLYEGSLNPKRRNAMKKEFLSAEASLLGLSIKAGGQGLHLCPGSEAIILFGNLPWSPSHIKQTWKRIHRLGQDCKITGNVTVLQLMAHGSADAGIAKLHRDKAEFNSQVGASSGKKAIKVAKKASADETWKKYGSLLNACQMPELGSDGLLHFAPPGRKMVKPGGNKNALEDWEDFALAFDDVATPLPWCNVTHLPATLDRIKVAVDKEWKNEKAKREEWKKQKVVREAMERLTETDPLDSVFD